MRAPAWRVWSLWKRTLASWWVWRTRCTAARSSSGEAAAHQASGRVAQDAHTRPDMMFAATLNATSGSRGCHPVSVTAPTPKSLVENLHLRSSQSSEHEPNHGQVDHGFALVSLPFVVVTESAVMAKPTKCALHDPASRERASVLASPNSRRLQELPGLARRLAFPSLGSQTGSKTPPDG